MPRLLFITSTRIGDAVLSTGALEAARARLPGARVTIACGPLAADLFRADPDLERLIVMPKRKMGGHWLSLWSKLVTTPFDLAVDLRGSGTTYVIAAKERIVFRPERVYPPRHKLEEFAALMGLPAPPEMKIHLDDSARAAADAFAGTDKKLLVLGASANWIGKIWPRDNFGLLARRLAGKGGPLESARVIALGGIEDGAVLNALVEDLGSAGLDARASVGALDMLACAAMLERAALFVGNDSGLMHLAGAMRAPTLGLFGPTDERGYGPRGPRARAVRGARYDLVYARSEMGKARRSLMDDLTVDMVDAAARDLLDE
jgi:lipopolysaccharide export system permease protein